MSRIQQFKVYGSGYTCKFHETSVLKKSMCQGKNSPLSAVPHIVLKRQQQELFATHSINFASSYSLQLKVKYSTKNASEHLTGEERDKTV